MSATTATEISPQVCAHCGLPIRQSPVQTGGAIFCCYACRLIAGVIGSRDEGDHAWNLLRLGFGALLAMNIMMLSLLLYSGSVETEVIPLFRWVMLALAMPAMAILLYPLVMAPPGKAGPRPAHCGRIGYRLYRQHNQYRACCRAGIFRYGNHAAGAGHLRQDHGSDGKKKGRRSAPCHGILAAGIGTED